MNLSKKMISTLKNIDMEEIISFIDKYIKEAYIENHDTSLQEWHQDFLLDEEGGLCLTDYLSSGNMYMSIYEGKAVILYQLPSCFEIGSDLFTIENIKNSLTEAEQKELFTKCLDELKWDIKDLREGYTLDDLSSEEMWVIEKIYASNYEEKYNNLKREYAEGNWNCYFRDDLLDSINTTLNEIINEIEE